MSEKIQLFCIPYAGGMAGAFDELKKLLTRRLELLQYHNRFDEDFPVKQPEISAEGNFVVLLSTNDNSSAVRLLKKLL